jgi:Probable Zinc-ribbon domain
MRDDAHAAVEAPSSNNNARGVQLKKKVFVAGRAFESINSAALAFRLSRNTVDYRLSKGWTPEQALGLEPRPAHAGRTAGVIVKVQGQEFGNIKQAAKHFGRSYTHVFERLKTGCTIEQALGLIKRTDSLQSEYPDLATQWHPTKNAPLAADAVTPGSGQKVWWLCRRGHEWKAVINSRARGMGCPYCAGQRPTADRNLATKYPELAEEWDWEKNPQKGPEDFTPRSSEKLWWVCKKGHSWQATICNRTRDYEGRGCPYCSNQKLGADNSLAQVRPDIAEGWHLEKNAPLTPNNVVAGGHRKVWWICKHGHEWQAPIGRRVITGSGCPKCSLQTSRIEIAVYSELVALFDDIVWREKIAGHECDVYLPSHHIGVELDGAYWHSRRPDRELAKSAAFEAAGIQLFRMREDGLPLLSERDIRFKFSDGEFHVISRLVSSMLEHALLPGPQCEKLRDYVNGPGLVNEKLYREMVATLPAPPPGQSFADKQPDIAKEWAYDLNAPLSPEHFRHKANKKVWWRCERGHTWRVSINSRTQQGTGCAACPRDPIRAAADRNLTVTSPELASEWHPIRNANIHPKDVFPKSNQKFWWQCSKGHEWLAAVCSRAAGSGCPYCYGRFATKTNNLANKHPELLGEWDSTRNGDLKPSDFTPRTSKKVWWRCAKGHSWQTSISNRTIVQTGCPHCWKTSPRPRLRKYNLGDMETIAARKGGKCLSRAYRGVEKKHRWQCAKGHEWVAVPKNLLSHDSWCPACARLKHRR